MHLVLFDIDGTLLHSTEFDSYCYCQAIREILDIDVDGNWAHYQHVTDTGILDELLTKLNLFQQSDLLIKKIKQRFIEKIGDHVSRHGVKATAGANEFLTLSREAQNIAVAIATGGWRESAILKLQSAGLNIDDIPIASADDHYQRIEIMKIAAASTGYTTFSSTTYFGDGIWDKVACNELGYSFIAVGGNVDHQHHISDFTDTERVIELIFNPDS